MAHRDTPFNADTIASLRITDSNASLSLERLLTSRWIWADQTGKIFSKSLYFGSKGNIKGYRTQHEDSWTLEDGILCIFDNQAKPFWRFDTIVQLDDRLALIGRHVADPGWWFSLTEYRNDTTFAPAEIDFAGESGEAVIDQESVRLVIWDLDETFWRGTLSEGGVTPIELNIGTVRTLADRGIVSSICSKNEYDHVKRVLVDWGVWEYFVFPQISFSPKGELVKKIVHDSQLRPETVMFIDDNRMNLNEALHYVPKLQLAEPDILPTLLLDPRFIGKPDPQNSRLNRYKALERKIEERDRSGGSNEHFLRQSEIRISFHNDVDTEFVRIHDLVNRTNQLNFTKSRWPEDIELARLHYHQEMNRFGVFASYVKVSDRFGRHGVCGFFMKDESKDQLKHFLFSCRIMNMGVEQFIWKRLDRPAIDVKPPVASDIELDVDWIRVVDDADEESLLQDAKTRLTVCIRGACDLMATSQYLRASVDTIEEFNYAYHGWEIFPLPRIIALRNEVALPENIEIIKRLPGLPVTRFDSDVIAGKADAYVISFSQESFCGYFRSKSTGMILPLRHLSINPWAHVDAKPDYTRMSFASVKEFISAGTTREQWEFIAEEFEHLGGFQPDLFIHDVNDMLTLLKSRNKPVVVIGLNDKIGRDFYILDFFNKINQIVKPIVRTYEFPYIDVANFISSENDLSPDGAFGGPHFARHVYAAIAEEVLRHIIKVRATG